MSSEGRTVAPVRTGDWRALSARGALVDRWQLWVDQYRRLWLSAFTVAVVLLGTLYLARPGTIWRLLPLSGVGALVAAACWPPVGLIVLVVATLLVPVAIGTGTETTLNVTVLLLPLLCGLWVLGMLGHRRLALVRSRPIRPLLAFCGVAFVAFLAGISPLSVFAESAPLWSQLGGLAVFLLSAVAFLLVAHQVRDERWLQRLVWLFLALGGLYVGGRLVPVAGQFTGAWFQFGATGSVFWTWLVALAFSQAAFNHRLRPPWRLAAAGLALATIYVALSSAQAWTSGWLPPIVTVVVILVAGSPRLGGLIVLSGGALATLSTGRLTGLLMTGDNQYSLTTRLEAWRILGQVAEASPVLGLGPANYYWYTPLYSIMGYHVRFNSHNNYVDIVAQTGFLGLACFLWFAWEAGRLSWQVRRRSGAGFARAYAIGSLGGLAGMLAAGMLGDWVLPFVYNIGLAGFRASVLGWLFLGGVVALEQISARRAGETASTPCRPRATPNGVS